MKKAVYYERVSTLNEEQTNSMENQRRLCEEFLKKHEDVLLAEPIDSYSERVSGKSDLREKYIDMMTRISKGDIDYILVKDLKRLSRSTEVSAQLRNQCRKYDVKLVLLSTNQIYDPNAEGNRMLYGFESLVNEEVVYRQSEYGRIAHRQKMEAKRLSSQNCTFGYRWDKGINDMVICEEEAEVVRQLFELLVFKDYGSKELREFLAKEKGIKVSGRTVRLWIKETAYIGIFHMNKKGSILGVGAGQKTKHYIKPENEWVSVERPDLAIVDPKLFELAQKVMESRKIVYDADKNGNAQARFKGKHLFSGKVFCEECGKSYTHCWTDRNKTIAAYRDSYVQKRKDASTSCDNKDYSRIYEDELEEIVRQSVNLFIKEHEKCFDVVLKALRSALAEELKRGDGKLKAEKNLQKLKDEAEKVLQSYLDASGSIKDALSKKYDDLTMKISDLEQEIRQMDNRVSQEDELEQKIVKISKMMDQLREIKKLDRKLVEHFVEKVLISKDGRVKIILKVGEVYIQQLYTWQEQKERRRIQKNESAYIFSIYSETEKYEIVLFLDKSGKQKTRNIIIQYLGTVVWVMKHWMVLREGRDKKRKRRSNINRSIEVWIGILLEKSIEKSNDIK